MRRFVRSSNAVLVSLSLVVGVVVIATHASEGVALLLGLIAVAIVMRVDSAAERRDAAYGRRNRTSTGVPKS